MRQFALCAGVVFGITLSATAGADDRSKDTSLVDTQLVSANTIANIQNALSEQRYMDAASFLEQAMATGSKNPMLPVLVGELELARGQNSEALAEFSSVDSDKTVRARALQGKGVALAAIGRSSEAVNALQDAVTQDPSAWRAWNVLGTEYDKRHDWSKAEDAYNHALAVSGSNPAVLNNRGFSRLSQGRLDDATADFLAALITKPDFSSARTNLRLAFAMKGDYDRAVKGGTGGEADQALLLNNAGVAAMMRNDLLEAQKLLEQAIETKGTYYPRAEANLQIVRNLLAQSRTERTPSDATNSH